MNNNEGNNNKKSGLFVQAGILAIAGIISRIIGLLYGSPLAAIIGDEGNGYYGAAYQVYSIVLLISSYSIPSAMSKIISGKLAVKEYKNAHKIFKFALLYVTVVGLVGTLILLFGADVLATGRSSVVLRFFAPTIFIFGFLGVLRGYFQAHRTMVPTSISQLLEQILNAIVSVGAALYLTRLAGTQDMSKRAMYGAIGSSLGTGAGVTIALLFMLFCYWTQREGIHRRIARDHSIEMPTREIANMVFLIVTPFILSTAIYNLSNFTNSTLFSRILFSHKGIEEEVVASMYGIFSRKAMVITNIPIAFASAAAAAMIPEISGMFAKGDKRGAGEVVERVNKAILIIAIPCASALIFLAKPIMMILFPQASLSQAATLLRILAVTVVFYSISTVSNAVLQGIGKVNVPVINAAIALVIQTAVLSFLLLFTNLNAYALCIVTILYSFLMCYLNSKSLRKHINSRTDYRRSYILPTISALIMGVMSYLTYVIISFMFFIGARHKTSDLEFGKYIYSRYFVNLIASLIAFTVAVVVYFAVLIKSGAAKEEDIKRLPKGASIARLLKKVRLL